MKVIFDKGPLADGTRFSRPQRIIRADGPGDVEAAFDAIRQAQERRSWLAGYFSYELGYCLSPRLGGLLPAERRLPLILLGEFTDCTPAPPPGDAPALPAEPALFPRWDMDRYAMAFHRVRDYIAAGDCYQVNLTFPVSVTCDAAPEALYRALVDAQPVGHGAYVDLDGPALLSRSPELFFEIDASGRISTRPMKGTQARGATPVEDEAAKNRLSASEKDRAENLMIVDLLRNDLSRISQVGSVRVPHLFQIESYATVHQMTSTVTSQLLPDTTLPDILRAIFPCGSVTGAPKIRAMEIIHELEDTPREAYCGAIGWVAPNGAMSFNVAIRTLIAEDPGRYALNVGGGVVHDSRMEAEYQEALWKARFARIPPTPR